MATFEKRKGKNGQEVWRVKVRRKGTSALSETFVRLTDARRWAQRTEAAIDEGRHFGIKEARKRTLGEAIDRYIHDILPLKAKTTQRKQRQQLLWWREQLGDRLLADVSPAVLAEYRDSLTAKYALGTAQLYIAVLSHVFTVAVRDWQWLEDDPLRRVKKPRQSRGRVRFLSEDERERLLEACTGSRNSLLYPVVVLALSTGARKSEILGITWPNVDFQRRMIRLLETKNGESRAVPLTGFALQEMQRLAKVRRIDSLYVFPGRSGTSPVNLWESWRYARLRAGIKDFRFHDLRHSAASYLAMNGASLAEIAEVLGHKTLVMVKRYAHLSEQHTAQVVERMNTAIFGKVAG
jgi:integrase